MAIPGRSSRQSTDLATTGAAMIVKRDGKYVVISERTGRSFGTYDTRAEAERRLRQVEFFKYIKRTRTEGGRRRASG
jgi:hypothetical protein